jgi:hypothetical protein
MASTWRIEHRNGTTHRAACDDPRRFAERATRLERLGERGEVVLVEAASGLVVARRSLAPFATRDAGTEAVRSVAATALLARGLARA